MKSDLRNISNIQLGGITCDLGGIIAKMEGINFKKGENSDENGGIILKIGGIIEDITEK